MLTSQYDEQNYSDEINFQSYIDAVKDNKIVWDIFVNLMKDLSHKNLNRLKQLNEILLKELKISIQEKGRCNCNQVDDIPLLDEIEYNNEIVENIKQDNENFNEKNGENLIQKFSDKYSEYDTESVVENFVDDEADYRQKEIESLQENYEKFAQEHDDTENIKHDSTENYENNFELIEYKSSEIGESNEHFQKPIVENLHKGLKNHKCNSCEKAYTQSHNLKTHISRSHTGHQCDSCGKNFSQSESLKTHVSIIHNHKCNSCEKSYTKAHDLKSHISKTHGKTAGHKCDSCGKNFSQLGSLKTHISIIHEGMKGYKCDLCNDKKLYSKNHTSKTHEIFGTQERLQRHIESVHLKTKVLKINKHNCKFCDESFSLPRNLQRHIQKIHEDKIYFLEDFSSPNEVFQILCGQTITPIELIPNGNKTNKKFILKHGNYQNFLNGANFHHPSDDKLAYESKACPTRTYVYKLDESGKIQMITKLKYENSAIIDTQTKQAIAPHLMADKVVLRYITQTNKLQPKLKRRTTYVILAPSDGNLNLDYLFHNCFVEYSGIDQVEDGV